MSRFNRLNIRIIRTITVLMVMCVGGVFFPVSFAVGESPVTPLSEAPASVQSSAGGVLDEDSLSWGSGNSPSPSPIAVPAMPVEPVASSSLPVLENPEVKPVSVVSKEDKTADEKTVEGNAFEDDADIEDTSEFLTRIKALEMSIRVLEEKVGKLQQDNEAAKKIQLKKASKAKKTAKTKRVSKVRKFKLKKVKIQHKGPDWVLRAASPGKAWVSEKGSNELRVVKAGETLEGIGKVNAIVKDSSGRWVVDGVGGRISQ